MIAINCPDVRSYYAGNSDETVVTVDEKNGLIHANTPESFECATMYESPKTKLVDNVLKYNHIR